MYLSYRPIAGFNLPVKIILAPRGMGKTFGAVYKGLWKFIDKGKEFIYVVETVEMVKTLSQNKGAKFFKRINDYLKATPSIKNNKMLEQLQANTEVSEFESKEKQSSSIQGGTIIINNKTAGYIVSFNDFANIKRNNFSNLSCIIIDEFVPEKQDVRTMSNPYKIVNIVQSIIRTDKVEIIMLANSIRLDDPILIRLGVHNMKPGDFRILNVDSEPFAICWLVNPEDYPEYMEKLDNSVAGKFAKLLKETSLDNNEFKNSLPQELLIPFPKLSSSFYFCLHGSLGSIRIHRTKSEGLLYIFHDYGDNTKKRYCINERFISPNIKLDILWKEYLLKYYYFNRIRFQDGVIFTIFKDILGIKDSNILLQK